MRRTLCNNPPRRETPVRKEPMDFKGKVAVVTGAGSGIGRALAQELARLGANLALADLEEGPLRETAALARQSGAEVHEAITDVSNREAVMHLAEKTFARFGRVHLLFNNAGVVLGGGLESARHQDWQWVLGVNLWGVIHGLEAFLPRMLAQTTQEAMPEGAQEAPAATTHWGHVVNTASMAGLIASEGMGIYNTSKAAVVSLSETLRKDIRGSGIGVSVLCPMGVATRINESERNRPEWAEDEGPANAAPPLLGRWIAPEAVSRQVMEAIRENRPYVLTHHEGKAHWERRAGRITGAFPPMPAPMPAVSAHEDDA